MRKTPLFLAGMCLISLLYGHEYTPALELSDYYEESHHIIILEGSHIVTRKSPGGEVLSLEDGALFSVMDGYESTLASWPLGMPVTLSFEGAYPWSTPSLYLTSISEGTSVAVELAKAPAKQSSITSQIFHVDLAEGLLYLRDAQEHESIWQIDDKDHLTLQTWNVYDSVIIGLNNSWHHQIKGSSTLFLINYDLLIAGSKDFFLPVKRLSNDYE